MSSPDEETLDLVSTPVVIRPLPAETPTPCGSLRDAERMAESFGMQNDSASTGTGTSGSHIDSDYSPAAPGRYVCPKNNRSSSAMEISFLIFRFLWVFYLLVLQKSSRGPLAQFPALVVINFDDDVQFTAHRHGVTLRRPVRFAP